MNYFSKYVKKFQAGGQVVDEYEGLVNAFLENPEIFALASAQIYGEEGGLVSREMADKISAATAEQKAKLKVNIKQDVEFCKALNELLPVAQEIAQSQQPSMKNGGKVEYLNCLKKGGNLPCDCMKMQDGNKVQSYYATPNFINQLTGMKWSRYWNPDKSSTELLYIETPEGERPEYNLFSRNIDRLGNRSIYEMIDADGTAERLHGADSTAIENAFNLKKAAYFNKKK